MFHIFFIRLRAGCTGPQYFSRYIPHPTKLVAYGVFEFFEHSLQQVALSPLKVAIHPEKKNPLLLRVVKKCNTCGHDNFLIEIHNLEQGIGRVGPIRLLIRVISTDLSKRPAEGDGSILWSD